MRLIVDTKVDESDIEDFCENFNVLINEDNWVDFNDDTGFKKELKRAKIIINQDRLNLIVSDTYINDKLFLWWLKKKDILFEILSENSEEYEIMDKKGYVFL